ncbi:MAG: superoxide dismutase family protein [Novosphingobium sp.]|nr:superoxide dismutase family protein [Novosphingobium sp.]
MMKRHIPTLVGAVLCLTTGASAVAATKPMRTVTIASGTLATATGEPAGTATITVARGGSPMLRITASGLPAGVHGVHIHTTGKCEGPAFTSAGGHLNPGGHQHGKDNPAGSHLGDLPNLTIDEHGNGELVQAMTGDAATLRAQLLDADGAAVVVHAAADDYHTDPSGNSGARIACAVLNGG